MNKSKQTLTPLCPYCGSFSELTTGWYMYPHRPDLHDKVFYRCSPCDAYVGCHPGTRRPLGRLANAELRAAKSAAHRAFDPMWKSGKMKRGQAYEWLAQQLGIDKDQCHIGEFDAGQCRRVIDLCVAQEFGD